jgi:hypothetical protein
MPSLMFLFAQQAALGKGQHVLMTHPLSPQSTPPHVLPLTLIIVIAHATTQASNSCMATTVNLSVGGPFHIRALCISGSTIATAGGLPYTLTLLRLSLSADGGASYSCCSCGALP